MDSTALTCPNCDAALHGKFCSACGQKLIEPEERTVKHFIYQFFGSAFFLENNFAKNLWVLISQPGRLSLDFIEGRRRRWMPPFSLLLLINLFYFWYSPLSDLNLNLKEQLNQPHHQWFSKSLVTGKIESENITMEQYAEKYNQKSTGYSNSLVILHIPIFALLLSFIYFRKKYFYVDHMIYAIYFLAFLLLAALLRVGIVYILQLIFPAHREIIWSISGAIFLISIFTFIYYSLKLTYYQKPWRAALSIIPVFAAFVISHLIYRTLLFLIIFSVT